MLPRQHKLSGSQNFIDVNRNGKKARTSTVLVTAYIIEAEARIISTGGPRFGFVISKKVGNSVVRHKVARQLRHICRKYIEELPQGCSLVIRALPKAAITSSYFIEKDFRTALEKLGLINA